MTITVWIYPNNTLQNFAMFLTELMILNFIGGLDVRNLKSDEKYTGIPNHVAIELVECTVYDGIFDEFLAGVISSNKVLLNRENGEFLPANKCLYKDDYSGMIPFFIGNYDESKEELPQEGVKWGFFNFETGEIEITPKYDYVGQFYRRLAEVRKKGKVGYIDSNGNEVIKIDWDEVYRGKLEWEYIDSEWVPKWDPWVVRKGNKWGYINEYGEIVIPLDFDHATLFIENRAKVKIGEKCGYINKKGEVVINPIYDEVQPFISIKNNNMKSCYIARVKKNGKYGFIDENGCHIAGCKFEDAFDFLDVGYAGVKYHNKWRIIDRFGNIIKNLEFDDMGARYGILSDNFLYYPQWQRDNEEDGFMQRSIGCSSKENVYFTVQQNSVWGIMDLDFNIIMPKNNEDFIEYRGKKIYIEIVM